MNEQLLLELLKQDAFVMEVASYKDPWLPKSDEVITEVYRSFASEMAELLGADFFAAMVIDELPSLRRGIALLSEGTSVNRLHPEGRTPTIEWLWDEAKGHSVQGSASQIRQWHQKSGRSADFFFVPYIVREVSLKGFPPKVESARSLYQGLTTADRNKFLYTEPELVSTCPGGFPFPKDGYYKAAWLIGITGLTPKRAFELIHNIESFSILFHMSWGYPELLKEKTDMAQRKAKQETQEALLSHLQGASLLAMNLVENVFEAYGSAVQVTQMLFPKDKVLLMRYRNAAFYIPEVDNKDDADTFHQNENWGFRHNWDVSLIEQSPKDTESFRAQVSCILLSFFGFGDLPPHSAPWTEGLDMPWVLLEKYRDKISNLFNKSFNETVAKVVSPGLNQNWKDDDIKTFSFLKGCFHYPFKDALARSGIGNLPSPLTGPLLALWAAEYGGKQSVDDQTLQFLSLLLPTQGSGWPSKYVLSALHGLYGYAKEEQPCKLKITADQGTKTGVLNVSVILAGCTVDYVTKLREISEATATRNASGAPTSLLLSKDLESQLGSLPGYIEIICRHPQATIEFGSDETTVTIRFAVRK